MWKVHAITSSNFPPKLDYAVLQSVLQCLKIWTCWWRSWAFKMLLLGLLDQEQGKLKGREVNGYLPPLHPERCWSDVQAWSWVNLAVSRLFSVCCTLPLTTAMASSSSCWLGASLKPAWMSSGPWSPSGHIFNLCVMKSVSHMIHVGVLFSISWVFSLHLMNLFIFGDLSSCCTW